MACLQCRNINVLVVLRRFCSIFLGDRLMRMVFGKDLEGHQCWCCFLRLWFNYSWFVVILLLLMCPWAWLSWPEVLPAVLIHRSANLICSSFFNLLPWRPDFNPHTDTKNNSNCHDSLGYSKPKSRTVIFTINAIHGVDVRSLNLSGRGNDSNKNHPIRNTKISHQTSTTPAIMQHLHDVWSPRSRSHGSRGCSITTSELPVPQMIAFATMYCWIEPIRFIIRQPNRK